MRGNSRKVDDMSQEICMRMNAPRKNAQRWRGMAIWLEFASDWHALPHAQRMFRKYDAMITKLLAEAAHG